MRLLVTRPNPDAKETAEALRRAGHEVVLSPLAEVVFCVPEGPEGLSLEGVQGLIATSRNGLRGLARALAGAPAALSRARSLPLFVVGPATAALARTWGFARIHEGAGAAHDLAPLIAAEMQPEKGALLYVTGQRLAYDLGAALSGHGFEVRRRAVYRMEHAAALAPEALDALARGTLDGVLLLSPAMARTWCRLIARHGLAEKVTTGGLTHYCLSRAIAAALEGLPGAPIAIAAKPNLDELLARIALDAAQSD